MGFIKLAEELFVALSATDRKKLKEFALRHCDTKQQRDAAVDAFAVGADRVKADDTRSRSLGKRTWVQKVGQSIRYAEEYLQSLEGSERLAAA